MGFIVLVLLASISLLIYLHKRRDKYFLVKSITFLWFASVIVSFSLYHNYTQSLVPGLYDGIGISNIIAYQFFPDHGWSIELFKRRFEQSIVVTIILLCILICMYFIERFKGKKI